MEKTISTNQASLIMCIFTIALKVSALPAIMFSFAGNDSYISCLIAIIFDFIGTVIIVNIMEKHPDETFFSITKETMGKTVAIITQVILLIYFIIRTILVLQELHDYFIATLFEELNPIYFLIILGLIMLYSTRKSFRTIGRLIELIFWPVAIAIAFTLVFPIKDLQIVKLLPVFEEGFFPIYRGLSRTTFAFGDYMILLIIMGKIKFEKKSKKKILIYMAGALSFIFNFFVIFVGCFGDFALNQTLALSELPLHNTTPATIGKLEWLTISIWTIILLVNAILLSIASVSVFDNIFGTNDRKWGSIVVTCIIMVAVTLTYLQLEGIVEFAISPAFASVVGGIQLSMIAILLIASVLKRNKGKSPPHKNRKKIKNKEKVKC